MTAPEDTCRPVEVDGEIIRVHGAAEMTDEAAFMALIDDIVYPFGPAQPQLTTGPTCICPAGVPDIWCGIDHHARQAMDRELGLLQPPPPLPPVPPCTCHYRVLWTRFALPPAGTRARHRTVVEGSSFWINPNCEHHGDLRRTEYFDATYTEVLDEDERRGH